MFWLFLTLGTLLFFLRMRSILPNPTMARHRVQPSRACITVAVFLGSGGHTSEALTLISALDFRRYNRRIYFVSEGDNLSAQKALSLETKLGKEGKYCSRVITIPRARRVHQSLLTTPFSAAWSLVFCICHLGILPILSAKRSAFADVLILNGPGTCFVLCVAVFVNKFFGLPAPVIIYVETFARVKSLSLSGKLIRPFVDRFVTQWSNSNGDGWLV